MKILLTILIIFSVSTPMSFASVENDDTLVIATRHIPPFAIKDNSGIWSGISIELWESMAQQLGIKFQYQEMSLNEMLEAVSNGQVDAAVAAISITAEREKKMDFTYPFISTGLGIATSAEDGGSFAKLAERIFSLDFLKALAALAGLLFIIGFIIWLFERNKNKHFGGKTHEGIGSGFWWSAVTMTTVGYGDKAPETLGGRTVALIWMFASVIIISSFTAAIATALTVNHLNGKVSSPNDLHNVKTATIADSTSAQYLEDNRIRYFKEKNLADALEALANGKYDAVVYDAAILNYQASQTNSDSIKVLPVTFEHQGYGIALPSSSLYQEPMNQTMLELLHSSKWNELLFRYLGTKN